MRCILQHMEKTVYAKWKMCNGHIIFQYMLEDKLSSENSENLYVDNQKI